jgi:hypothetical protein
MGWGKGRGRRRSIRVEEFKKRHKDNAEAQCSQRSAEEEKRNPRAQSGVTVPQRRNPKTQAQTPCLGQPPSIDERAIVPRSLHCATAKGAVASVGMTIQVARKQRGGAQRKRRETQEHSQE